MLRDPHPLAMLTLVMLPCYSEVRSTLRPFFSITRCGHPVGLARDVILRGAAGGGVVLLSRRVETRWVQRLWMTLIHLERYKGLLVSSMKIYVRRRLSANLACIAQLRRFCGACMRIKAPTCARAMWVYRARMFLQQLSRECKLL